MSGATVESRGGRQNRQSGQQRPSQGSREGTPSALQSRKAGGKPVNQSKPSESTSSSPALAAIRTDSPDTHVSVTLSSQNHASNDSVIQHTDVEATLKKSVESKPVLYTPESKGKPTSKPGSPWAAKPSTMTNGKDFWVELRKQVAALQQSGGTSQGG